MVFLREVGSEIRDAGVAGDALVQSGGAPCTKGGYPTSLFHTPTAIAANNVATKTSVPSWTTKSIMVTWNLLPRHYFSLPTSSGLKPCKTPHVYGVSLHLHCTPYVNTERPYCATCYNLLDLLVAPLQKNTVVARGDSNPHSR